jgi:putative membrane protein
MSKDKGKILILCVDRDNDIGFKAQIQTPIISRKLNLDAASKLVLQDPEESDANAMFAAVRVYDELSKENLDEEYEVATIAGFELGGVKADRLILNQLSSVLEKFPANNVILVTDGFGDEELIPIIQSRIPILSIKRIVVKHSEAIEESWALFSRYLRKLIEDPYYSRWFLGVPGVLLIALATLWFLNTAYISIFLLLFFGLLFIIRGFRIDQKIQALIFPSPPNLVRLFTTITSLIVFGIGVYQTYSGLITILGDPYLWYLNIHLVLGYGIQLIVDLVLIAFLIFLIGLTVFLYFMRDQRIWWITVGIVATLWMREIALKASDILILPPPFPDSLIQSLILVVGLGISTTIITFYISIKSGKKFDYYFKKRGEK